MPGRRPEHGHVGDLLHLRDLTPTHWHAVHSYENSRSQERSSVYDPAGGSGLWSLVRCDRVFRAACQCVLRYHTGQRKLFAIQMTTILHPASMQAAICRSVQGNTKRCVNCSCMKPQAADSWKNRSSGDMHPDDTPSYFYAFCTARNRSYTLRLLRHWSVLVTGALQ